MTVTGAWSPADAQQYRESGADELVLNYAHGFQERSLDFIADLPVVRLEIVTRTIKDLEPIYALAPGLHSVKIITSTSASLDLTRLPWLQRLSANWEQVKGSIHSGLLLSDLYLAAYAEKDLTPLAGLNSLQNLRMKERRRIENLAGLQSLKKLSSITIAGGQHLVDVDELQAIPNDQLESLWLEACGQLSSLDAVSNCTALKYLNYGNNGNIASVAPLGDLQRLESLVLYESTRIDDGDLAPLLGLTQLRRLAMKNRRHYSPSVSDVLAAIASR